MTLTCEEGDASSVSQDPGGGLTNFCPIRENVWWLCELSNEEFWSSVTEAAQHLGCHCVSPPYCHPVSLAEVPRSLPSVSASSSLTAGVSGGHQDSRSLEMVRAAEREEEAAASRGDSGDSSGSAGPRCPGPAGWTWVSRQSHRPGPRRALGATASRVSWAPASLQSGSCRRRVVRNTWFRARVRGGKEESCGVW